MPYYEDVLRSGARAPRILNFDSIWSGYIQAPAALPPWEALL
jgi:hypothetical protein